MSVDKTGKIVSRGDIVSFVDWKNSKVYGRVIAIELETGEIYLEEMTVLKIGPQNCVIENPDKVLDKLPGMI